MSAAGEANAAADLLATIVASTRRTVEVRRAREPLSEIRDWAARTEPRRGIFFEALGTPGRINVIAECKRRSPSRGVLRREYDPAVLARAYDEAGAAAISVLTEPTFFDGSLEHLSAVRAVSALPVLRKDFVVDEYQVWEARAFGADAVLLIVAALQPGHLEPLLASARDAGLDVLVEVHDRAELKEALDSGARLVGVNSRNLRTLEVDPDVCGRIIEEVPAGLVTVAESGLRSAKDIARLRRAGYSAFLIGEALVSSADPRAALRALLEEAAREGRCQAG
jgi:indole-3-glycerol phosphate synthase